MAIPTRGEHVPGMALIAAEVLVEVKADRMSKYTLFEDIWFALQRIKERVTNVTI